MARARVCVSVRRRTLATVAMWRTTVAIWIQIYVLLAGCRYSAGKIVLFGPSVRDSKQVFVGACKQSTQMKRRRENGGKNSKLSRGSSCRIAQKMLASPASPQCHSTARTALSMAISLRPSAGGTEKRTGGLLQRIGTEQAMDGWIQGQGKYDGREARVKAS